MTLKKTIRDCTHWAGKRVLLRVDFNVPLNASGEITDTSRIEESLPTLKYLQEAGARIILVSHLGRPKGTVVESMRLTPVAGYLAVVLGAAFVGKTETVVGDDVQTRVQALEDGEILLLENVRFEPGEEANEAGFAKQLAALADVYVNDAFGTAHRAHASTEGVAHYLSPALAGFLMDKEIRSLTPLLQSPERPFTAIIGGSKISSKFGVLSSLLTVADTLVIGGGMMFTFLAAQGFGIGKSMVELDFVSKAEALLKQANGMGKQIWLGEDLIVADRFAPDAATQTVSVCSIPGDMMALDIGPKSCASLAPIIEASKTILWNGPMGVFEMPAFASGTKTIAETVARWTQEHHGFSVLGGGDTLAALEQFHIGHEGFTHVSTGGGASLEFLEGITLPGIAVLDDATTLITR